MNGHSTASRFGTAIVAGATALVLIAVAIVPFLSPAWVAFEQDRSGAAALTGLPEPQLRVATNAILADLVLGPPDFDVEIGGAAVLTPDERSHMRDVRDVFIGFGLVAGAAFVLVVAAFAAGSRGPGGWSRADAWRGVRRGAIGLGIGVVATGVIAAVAFDAAFEVFHRLFFPGGNWAFDPRTSRLVQLFPFDFWYETTIAVGALILGLALLTAWFAGRRLRPPATVPAAAVSGSGSLAAPGPEPAK
ncbi:MAG TPA: DUF1461 domain-containing protein [Candidatus Limnocylindrales bacterium]|nr:DUF1461 domain-containing protein [Candidatus Limnocylindrales bacterium]